MLQFHSWPFWKCKNNKNLHMLGLCPIPWFFQHQHRHQRAPFFAPNKHQRWWGLLFSNQQDCWSSKLMYVWNLETYFPGVIKFGHLKMHGLPSWNTTSFGGFHHPSCWKETPPWGLTCFQCLFHLIGTSPVRQIQNCKMWMALENEESNIQVADERKQINPASWRSHNSNSSSWSAFGESL